MHTVFFLEAMLTMCQRDLQPDSTHKKFWVSEVQCESALGMLNTCSVLQGNVMPGKFEMLRNWKKEYTIEAVLLELRREMASSSNRKLSQPPENTSY